jgi:hypothetical protein
MIVTLLVTVMVVNFILNPFCFAAMEAVRDVISTILGTFVGIMTWPIRFLALGIGYAIDALAAREPNRLGRTIQICDTGISPGSGVGNDRVRLDYETLGVKVIAIGVPTVISVPSIVNQALDGLIEIFLSRPEGKNVLLNDDEKNNLICNLLEDNLISMFVTPKSIDESVKRISFTISEAINSFLEFQ